MSEELSLTYLSTSKLPLMFMFGELAPWGEGKEI